MNVRILSVITLLALMMACGGSKRDGLANYVGRFLLSNNEVIMVMKLDLGAILDKVAIGEIPEIGGQFAGNIEQFYKGAALAEKVYVIGQGALNNENMPEEVYIFMAVEDEKEMAALLNEMGYFFDKESGLNIHEEMDLSIGFKDDVLIAVLSETQPKEKLLNAFNRVKSGKVNEQMMTYLDREGDILLSLHLENLYTTANTDLNRLPIQQQEKFKRLAQGSFVNTVVQFNTGELVVETHLDFNDELSDAMFLAKSGSNNALSKIGPGEPILVAALHLDIQKMDEMLLSDYPEILKQMYSKMGPQGLLLKTLGGGKLASFINGEIAFAVTDIQATDDKEEPYVTLYTGLGKSSGDLAELIAMLAEEKDAQKIGEGTFKYDGYTVKMNKEGMIMSSDPDMSAGALGNSPLTLSAHMRDILTSPVAFYIDFDALAGSDADKILGDAEMAVNYIDFISFTADNKKARLVIKFIDTEKNILKQSVDIALENLF